MRKADFKLGEYIPHIESIFQTEKRLNNKTWLPVKFIRRSLYNRGLPKLDQRILGDLLGRTHSYSLNAHKMVRNSQTYYSFGSEKSIANNTIEVDFEEYCKWDRETGY
jgi:hypothetical protein